MEENNNPNKIHVGEQFYRNLEFNDDKILANIDLAIDLYTGKLDKKEGGDSAVNYERALGIFSISYLRIAQDILRKREADLTPEQKIFLNFGVLDERLIQNDAVVEILISEIQTPLKHGNFEVYYMNEWMEKIARGSITPTSDAAQVKSKTKTKEDEDKLREKRKKLEEDLGNLYKQERETFIELSKIFKLISPDGEQGDKLKILNAARKRFTQLEHIVHEQNIRYSEVESIKAREKTNEDALNSADGIAAKYERIKEEFSILINVMKSCAARGRLLRNTPVLIDKWIPLDQRLTINIKEQVAKLLDQFEEVDCSIFRDREGNRKAPKVLIVPGIGTGMAWRDRLMIPLFAPPTLQADTSILRTLAGFRWHITTASYNWKELPGEIGSMYKLIYPDLSFTNLERSFTDDYVKWVTKEALGFQVLPPNVRSLFWKKIPFSDTHKKELAKRATVYGKLLSGDQMHGN